MTLLHSLFRALDFIKPANVAHAHCDIPCGIYDPHLAQLAAHTVIRMAMLTDEVTSRFKALPSPTAEERRDFITKLARYTATKEEHAELCKKELRILWGDYFKPEHMQTFPELHELVWKALKAASKARQSVNVQDADELLKLVNDIAEIFWKTKGKDVVRAKAPYPTEREIVLPKL